MANNNKRIRVGELDFDGIKDNLKEYLKTQDQFKDYNFEGSGLSVLLDVLAYNTHYNALYTNLAVNEMFLDSASKRDSVVSIAKMLGYLPRSAKCAKATVNIRIVATGLTPPPFVTLPAGTSFVTTIDQNTYLFYNRESYSSALIAGAYTFNGVVLTEGKPLEYRFVYEDTLRFVIPNKDVDIDTLSVRVQESSTGAFTTYNYSNKITSVEKDTRAYFLKEVEDGKYEIYFGDGIIGYKPSSGNIVLINYVKSSKAVANGASTFNMQGSTANLGTVTITTTSPAVGGADPESIASIKANAPVNYSAQNRAVTAEDYKVILPQLYSNVDTISVWGGEENDPPTYGKVLRILVTSTIYYNPITSNIAGSSIESLVRQAIVNFNRTELNKFDSVMRYSRLSSVIDSAADGIVNSNTIIRLTRSIVPVYNRVQSYAINIGNPIYSEAGITGNIVSSGFSIPGSTTTFFVEDNGLGFLRRFSVTSTGQKIISPGTVGTVNYKTGKILLQSINIDAAENNLITFTIRPASNDVVSVRNQLATIKEDSIVLRAIEDKVASGETTAGNYVFTSNTL